MLGIAPFGLVVGVAMVAGGLSPAAAMSMSLIAYAGASMLAATQWESRSGCSSGESHERVVCHAGMGLITLGLRVSFLLLPERIHLPELLRRALPFVPAAVLTAVSVPELLLQKGVLYLSLHNERLLAGIAAILVAWRWRLTFVTIASGLLALHFFDWLL